MSQTIAPVTYSVTVPISAQRAFTLFTEGFNTWWIGHHIGEADLAEVVIEPRVDGRWFERGVDGTECDWGKVLVYEPPGRLVLTWQLNSEFQYDPDPVPRQRGRGAVHRGGRPDHGRLRAPAHRAARRGRRGTGALGRVGRRLAAHPGSLCQGGGVAGAARIRRHGWMCGPPDVWPAAGRLTAVTGCAREHADHEHW